MPVAVRCLEEVIESSGHLKLCPIAQSEVQSAGEQRHKIAFEIGECVNGPILVSKSRLHVQRTRRNQTRVLCQKRALLRVNGVAGNQKNKKRNNEKKPSNRKCTCMHGQKEYTGFGEDIALNRAV